MKYSVYWVIHLNDWHSFGSPIAGGKSVCKRITYDYVAVAFQIDDVWKEHVARLGLDKSGARAVHTYYLFRRVLFVLRHQFSLLTREACNYLGDAYHTIASHFLVTVELLSSELQLPMVYVDSELVRTTYQPSVHVFVHLTDCCNW